VIAEVMNILSPRERLVIEALRQGKSPAEIGETMGISKQTVNKIENCRSKNGHKKRVVNTPRVRCCE